VEETKVASQAAASKLQVAMHAELEKAQLL
jgi:hypothetical protein